MIPNPDYSISQKLSGQGQHLDAEQAMRLELAGDPIYAHIATLATATALNGLAWEQKTSFLSNDPKLKVVNLGKRTPFKKLQKGIDGEIQLDNGVKLVGRVRLDDSWRHSDDYHRAFDPSVDKALIKTSASATMSRFILSSSIMLERESDVINADTIKLGVIAQHATKYEHRKDEVAVATVNRAADPTAFEGLMNILERVDETDDGEEETFSRYTLLKSRQQVSTTSDPSLHFNFHEALGVDEKTLTIARANYETLRLHLGLPYQLPSDTSSFD